MSGLTVTFDAPWGRRSWKVTHNLPSELYCNDRQPHVEVGELNMGLRKKGEQFTLINPHNMRGKAIVFDVEGVKNGTHQAHFTVYFGSEASSKLSQYTSAKPSVSLM